MRSTGSLCCFISNTCKVGTGIRQQKGVAYQHALLWTFHVCSHRHISSRNWTVHGWREALDCEGISQAYGDFQVCGAPNFMTGLKMWKIAAKWVIRHLAEVQQWMHYEACCVCLEQFCHEGDMLKQIILINEMWARAYKPEFKGHSPKWCHLQSPWKCKIWQNLLPVKLVTILVYDVRCVLVAAIVWERTCH
jgi:hypothetical protein